MSRICLLTIFLVIIDVHGIFAGGVPRFGEGTPYPEEKDRILSRGNRTYFIDPQKGDDHETGTNAGKAWKTFGPVNRMVLAGGDKIEIISPGIFNESLVLMARGQKNAHVSVHFAPGVYHFFREQAYQTKLNISNTNDVPDSLKAIALLVRSSSFTDIKGYGAKLIMHGKMIETCIDHSGHINLSGLTYDYERPTVSEMRVTKAGPDFAEWEVHPDSKYSIKDSLLTFQGEGWSYRPISLWQVLDPGTGDLQRTEIEMNGIRYAEIGKNLIRVYYTRNPGFKEGLIYQNRDVTRDCAGFFLRRNSNIELKNLHINFMHGMGVVSQFCQNILIDSMVVRPDPASGRTSAAWADILHFSGCRGDLAIRNSYLSAANDDAINVHGTYLRILGSPRADQLLVRFMHDQTYGFEAFVPGDSIAIINGGTLLQIDSNQVVESKRIDDREFLLTLKRRLTVVPGLKDAVENITWTPNVRISHNTITRIPTRGILVTSRRKVIIEDNLLQVTHSAAISIADDANSWYESGMVKDVTIRNNDFVHCGQPVIIVNPENPVKLNIYVHRNIRILSNKFELKSYREAYHALDIRNTTSIDVTGNHFHLADAPKSPKDLFWFQDCMGVHVGDNQMGR